MVPEILEKLQALQEVLSQKYVVESELKEIPKSLATKQEILGRLKKSFVEKNAQYDESRIKLVDLRGKIEQAGKDREQSEAMIVDISTQREYEALLKQIKDASDREQQFRRDLQREEKAYEELGSVIEREGALITQQESEYTAEQEKIASELDKRKSILTKLDKKEAALTNDDILDPEIIFKFRRIIRKKEGRGIVPLRKGVCTGCNMILPMEFVNEVRSGESIFFCPYCSMILFHEDTEDSYYAFDFDSMNSYDEDAGDDEELDEALLMEEEMKESIFDEVEEEGAEDEDGAAEDDIESAEVDEDSDDVGEDELVETGIDDEASVEDLQDEEDEIEDDE